METVSEEEALKALEEFAEKIQPGAVEELTKGVMLEGYTYGDFTELTDEDMDAAYANAFVLIDQGKSSEAEGLFRFLMTLDHHDHRFWMGLGVALQVQGKYREANQAYTYLFTLDYENCIPPLRSAECLLSLGEHKLALGAAVVAEAAAARKPEQYKKELACAKLILGQIESLLSAGSQDVNSGEDV